MATRHQDVLDTFTRANSDNLGADWTEHEGDIDIVNNKAAVITVAASATHGANPSNANCYVKAKFEYNSDSGTRPQVILRSDDYFGTAYYVMFRHDQDDVIFYRKIGGTPTEVGSSNSSVAYSSGSTYEAEIDGTGSTVCIRAYVNGILAASTQDTHVDRIVSNGRCGFRVALDRAYTIDDYEHGYITDFTTTSTTTSTSTSTSSTTTSTSSSTSTSTTTLLEMRVGFFTDQHWYQSQAHEGSCHTSSPTSWEDDVNNGVNKINGSYPCDRVFVVGDQLHRESITDAQLTTVLGGYETAMDNLSCPWYWCHGNHEWFDTYDPSCPTESYEIIMMENSLDSNSITHGHPRKLTFQTSGGQDIDFIQIDSGAAQLGHIEAEDITWLQNNLHATRVTFLMFHHPQDGSSDHQKIDNPSDINNCLDNYGNVKAVFTGHNHNLIGHWQHGTKNVWWIAVRRGGGSWGVSYGLGILDFSSAGARYKGVRIDDGDASSEEFLVYTGTGGGTTTSTSSTTTSSSTSSTTTSTSTTLSSDSGGLAFGEQTPTQSEIAVSWQTYSDGAGGIPSVTENANWGKIQIDVGEQGRSRVYKFQNSIIRVITVTENRYGSGQESATIQIRGHDSVVFTQDAESPSWEAYSSPISKTWQYIQVRVVK